MRAILSLLLCVCPLLVLEGAILGAKALQPKPLATCSGTTPCYACTTCNYCYTCSKAGGRCGVCLKK